MKNDAGFRKEPTSSTEVDWSVPSKYESWKSVHMFEHRLIWKTCFLVELLKKLYLRSCRLSCRNFDLTMVALVFGAGLAKSRFCNNVEYDHFNSIISQYKTKPRQTEKQTYVIQ